jgi:imidazolonepropionase-like amidohydrolase
MLRLIPFLLLLLSLSAQSQNDTLFYSVVAAGNIKGFNKVWKHTDGSFEEWYQFNDRGRGDSIRTIYREDAEGFPLHIKAGGVDYMKNRVSEEFSFADGKARWKNSSEDEEMPVAEKAFFMPLKTAAGHLVKALQRHNNKLKLLPFGELEMTVLQTQEVKHGSETQKVSLVQLKGLGYTPSYSWIDADGVDFAQVNEWQSVIRRGYEGAIDELLQVQQKHEAKFYTDLAATLPQPLPASVLLKNVALFDSKSARVMPARDVLIENGVIKTIAAGNTIKRAVAQVIDGSGKTALPGLWDMHTHMSGDLEGILNIAAGVSHVRDMGNGEGLLTRAGRFREGTIIGPRVEIMSGFIDAKDPMAAPTGTLINSVEEGKKAIRDYAAKGYQQIKLYSSIKPSWVKPLADEAHRFGLRVCGHIPAFMTATTAIQNGYDEITHLNMLALNFFGDTIDTRDPRRFSVPAKHTASLNLQGTEMKKFIQLLKQKNIAVDPTLIVFEDLFTARDKVVAPKFVPIANRFPATMQRYIKAGGGGLPVPDGLDETYKKSFAAFLAITKLLYDNGIHIFAGTDDIPGFGLHRELELYVQAGIPAAKVLQMATWNAAVYTGKSADYGDIAVGKKTDLILVDGNPTNNISNIRNTRLVIANGRSYDPALLYKAISVKPL